MQGVSLTVKAFESVLGPVGRMALVIVVVMFGVSTMFSYSYYGRKCFDYVFGAGKGRVHDIVYLASLFLGAVWSVDAVVNLLDTAFAMMALPNMIATLLLAPRVVAAARDYLERRVSLMT